MTVLDQEVKSVKHPAKAAVRGMLDWAAAEGVSDEKIQEMMGKSISSPEEAYLFTRYLVWMEKCLRMKFRQIWASPN